MAVSTLATAFFLVCMTGVARAETPAGPSFDCKALTGIADVATGIADVVCRTPDLAAADRRMAKLYAAVQTDVLGYGPSPERQVQREWLRTLYTHCDAASMAKYKQNQTECVRRQYKFRLHDLAVAALLSHHSAAMAEIRRSDPDDAPVYEALYLYATIDDPNARAAQVTAVLTPLYPTLADAADTYRLGSPKSAAEAAASDDNFAGFLQLASLEARQGITIPCAVLVKRPVLIDALTAEFGSQMDGRLPGEDCYATAPHVQALEAIMDAVTPKSCDGITPIGGYRDLEHLRVTAILHYDPTSWHEADPPEADSEEAAYRKRRAGAIAAARGALSAYYVRVFHIDGKSAARDATRITNLMISRAYTLCDD